MNVQNVSTVISFTLGLLTYISTTSSIEGALSDASTGKPIGFATVILYKNDRPIKAVASDIDGYFMFEELPSDVYELVVNQPGYQSLIRKNVYVGEAEAKEIDLQLSSSDGDHQTALTNIKQENPKGKLLKKIGRLLEKFIDKKIDDM